MDTTLAAMQNLRSILEEEAVTLNDSRQTDEFNRKSRASAKVASRLVDVAIMYYIGSTGNGNSRLLDVNRLVKKLDADLHAEFKAGQ